MPFGADAVGTDAIGGTGTGTPEVHVSTTGDSHSA